MTILSNMMTMNRKTDLNGSDNNVLQSTQLLLWTVSINWLFVKNHNVSETGCLCHLVKVRIKECLLLQVPLTETVSTTGHDGNEAVTAYLFLFFFSTNGV
jgi:hypothetical protein